MGSIFRPTYRAADGTRRAAAVWWLKYRAQGRIIRESSGTENRKAAERTLRIKEGAAEEGRPVIPRADKVTVGDLLDTLAAEYKSNGRRVDRLAVSLKHLRPVFDPRRALHVSSADVIAYSATRQAAGAANASINRELAALKRAYRLALTGERLPRAPHIPLLREDNVRQGFFERAAFEAVRSRLAPELRGLVTAAFITGWRVPSELQTLQWRQVDPKAGTVRLEPGTTKNRDGRTFIMTSELREVLEAQRAETDRWQRARGRIIPWVFHRHGKPIRDFRTAWRLACEQAGVPGRIPHDLRRTAVRNLERAGVSRSVAMKLVGHKTEAVYRRYSIADEQSLREAAVKLDAASTLGKVSGKVAPVDRVGVS
jgi:integrase